jgi:hypothetical protein
MHVACDALIAADAPRRCYNHIDTHAGSTHCIAAAGARRCYNMHVASIAGVADARRCYNMHGACIAFLLLMHDAAIELPLQAMLASPSEH